MAFVNSTDVLKIDWDKELDNVNPDVLKIDWGKEISPDSINFETGPEPEYDANLGGFFAHGLSGLDEKWGMSMAMRDARLYSQYKDMYDLIDDPERYSQYLETELNLPGDFDDLDDVQQQSVLWERFPEFGTSDKLEEFRKRRLAATNLRDEQGKTREQVESNIISAVADMNQWESEGPPQDPKVALEWAEAKGWGPKFKFMLENPKFVAQTASQSFGEMSPILGATILGSIFIPGGGLLAAGPTGWSIGDLHGLEIALRHHGVDPRNPDHLISLLDDPDKINLINESRRKYSARPGIGAAISGGIGGWLMAGRGILYGTRAAAPTVGQMVGRAATSQAIEPLAEGATEAWALAGSGMWDPDESPGDVIMEAVAGAPVGTLQAGIGTIVDAKARSDFSKTLNREREVIDTLKQVVKESGVKGEVLERIIDSTVLDKDRAAQAKVEINDVEVDVDTAPEIDEETEAKIREKGRELANRTKGVRDYNVEDMIRNIRSDLGERGVLIFKDAFNEQHKILRGVGEPKVDEKTPLRATEDATVDVIPSNQGEIRTYDDITFRRRGNQWVVADERGQAKGYGSVGQIAASEIGQILDRTQPDTGPVFDRKDPSAGLDREFSNIISNAVLGDTDLSKETYTAEVKREMNASGFQRPEDFRDFYNKIEEFLYLDPNSNTSVYTGENGNSVEFFETLEDEEGDLGASSIPYILGSEFLKDKDVHNNFKKLMEIITKFDFPFPGDKRNPLRVLVSLNTEGIFYNIETNQLHFGLNLLKDYTTDANVRYALHEMIHKGQGSLAVSKAQEELGPNATEKEVLNRASGLINEVGTVLFPRLENLIKPWLRANLNSTDAKRLAKPGELIARMLNIPEPGLSPFKPYGDLWEDLSNAKNADQAFDAIKKSIEQQSTNDPDGMSIAFHVFEELLAYGVMNEKTLLEEGKLPTRRQQNFIEKFIRALRSALAKVFGKEKAEQFSFNDLKEYVFVFMLEPTGNLPVGSVDKTTLMQTFHQDRATGKGKTTGEAPTTSVIPKDEDIDLSKRRFIKQGVGIAAGAAVDPTILAEPAAKAAAAVVEPPAISTTYRLAVSIPVETPEGELVEGEAIVDIEYDSVKNTLSVQELDEAAGIIHEDTFQVPIENPTMRQVDDFAANIIKTGTNPMDPNASQVFDPKAVYSVQPPMREANQEEDAYKATDLDYLEGIGGEVSGVEPVNPMRDEPSDPSYQAQFTEYGGTPPRVTLEGEIISTPERQIEAPIKAPPVGETIDVAAALLEQSKVLERIQKTIEGEVVRGARREAKKEDPQLEYLIQEMEDIKANFENRLDKLEEDAPADEVKKLTKDIAEMEDEIKESKAELAKIKGPTVSKVIPGVKPPSKIEEIKQAIKNAFNITETYKAAKGAQFTKRGTGYSRSTYNIKTKFGLSTEQAEKWVEEILTLILTPNEDGTYDSYVSIFRDFKEKHKDNKALASLNEEDGGSFMRSVSRRLHGSDLSIPLKFRMESPPQKEPGEPAINATYAEIEGTDAKDYNILYKALLDRSEKQHKSHKTPRTSPEGKKLVDQKKYQSRRDSQVDAIENAFAVFYAIHYALANASKKSQSAIDEYVKNLSPQMKRISDELFNIPEIAKTIKEGKILTKKQARAFILQPAGKHKYTGYIRNVRTREQERAAVFSAIFGKQKIFNAEHAFALREEFSTEMIPFFMVLYEKANRAINTNIKWKDGIPQDRDGIAKETFKRLKDALTKIKKDDEFGYVKASLVSIVENGKPVYTLETAAKKIEQLKKLAITDPNGRLHINFDKNKPMAETWDHVTHKEAIKILSSVPVEDVLGKMGMYGAPSLQQEIENQIEWYNTEGEIISASLENDKGEAGPKVSMSTVSNAIPKSEDKTVEDTVDDYKREAGFHQSAFTTFTSFMWSKPVEAIRRYRYASPTMAKLADMIQRDISETKRIIKGGLDYIQRKGIALGQFRVALQAPLDKLTGRTGVIPKHVNDAIALFLIQGTPIKNPKIAEAAEEMKRVLESIYTWSTELGSKTTKGFSLRPLDGGLLPRVWNVEELATNQGRKKFMQLLASIGIKDNQNSENEFEQTAATDAYNIALNSGGFISGDFTTTAYNQKSKKRRRFQVDLFQKIEQEVSRAKLGRLLVNDIQAALPRFVDKAIEKTLYAELFGHYDEVLWSMKEQISKEIREYNNRKGIKRPVNESMAMQDINDMMDIIRHRYKMKSTWFNPRRYLQWFTNFTTVTLMPFVSLASMPEFFTPVMLGSKNPVGFVNDFRSVSWYAALRAMNGMSKVFRGKQLDAMLYPKGKAARRAMFLKALGIIDIKSQGEAAAMRYIGPSFIRTGIAAQGPGARLGIRALYKLYGLGDESTGRFRARKVRSLMNMDTYFEIVLLTTLTQMQQQMAANNLRRFTISLLKSVSKGGKNAKQNEKILKDFGLTPEEISEAIRWYKAGHREFYDVPSEFKWDPSGMTLRFVDQVITRPNEATMSKAFRHPAMAPILIFKSFMTTFGNTFMVAMRDRVRFAEGEGTAKTRQQAKMVAGYLATMAAMYGMVMFAQSVRQMLQYEDDDDDYMKDVPEWKKFVAMLNRTGLLTAPGSQLVDIFLPYKYGWWQKGGERAQDVILGPAYGQSKEILNLITDLANKGEVNLEKFLARIAPITKYEMFRDLVGAPSYYEKD